MTERLMKRDLNNSKKDKNRIMIGKTWEINICDGNMT